MMFIRTICLSQVITGPTYLAKHILDLVYYIDREDDLEVQQG